MSDISTTQPETQTQGGRKTVALFSAFNIIARYPVLIALGLVTLFAQITYSGINNVTLPKYVPMLGVAPGTDGRITGLLISVFLFTETLVRIPFGWLSDRFGRKIMIVGAMLLTVPTVLCSGFITSYKWLIPLRGWDGIMAAALWPSLFALIGDVVPERHRANAMGVINMMYMLALFSGWALAGAVVSQTQNPRLFFFIGAIVIGLGGLIAWIGLRQTPETHEVHAVDVHDATAETPNVPVSRHIVLLCITFTQNFAITLLAPFMFRYVTEDLGFSLQQLAVLVGVPVVGIALCALPLSRVGDVLGKLTTVRLAFTAIALALWFFAFQKTLFGLAATAAVIGIAFSMGIPAWMALLCSLSCSKTRGATLAGYGTVQGAAAVLGPLAAGQVWDRLGHPHIFMTSAIVITLAATMAWVALPKQTACSPNTPTAV